MTVVYLNNQPSLYVNGVLVRTGLASPKLVHPSAEMGEGAYGYRAGFMDEYTVYDRALSSNEVQSIFTVGSAGKCLPPTMQISPPPGAVQLSWQTNVTGYLLETKSAVASAASWGVLASSYTIIATNFTVTSPIRGAARFYRLR